MNQPNPSCSDRDPVAHAHVVRRMRVEDAEGVVGCVRAVYGDTYVHPELYDPQRLVELNESGRQVSVVALDLAGRVVGHYALERRGQTDVVEECEEMVVPEHRHERLMERMRAALEVEAHRSWLCPLLHGTARVRRLR